MNVVETGYDMIQNSNSDFKHELEPNPKIITTLAAISYFQVQLLK